MILGYGGTCLGTRPFRRSASGPARGLVGSQPPYLAAFPDSDRPCINAFDMNRDTW
jgi:hypothetical protein